LSASSTAEIPFLLISCAATAFIEDSFQYLF
jgi:hypothetical protein